MLTFYLWENNYLFLDIMDKIYSRNPFKNFSINRKPNNIRKMIKIIVILVIAFSVVYYSLKSFEPIIERNCKNIARSIATKISNDESTKVMKKYEYQDIVLTTNDEDGNVKMLKIDIFTVNKIISDIPVYIQNELEKTENNTFEISLGSFLGSKVFSGIGPKVKVKINTVGDLETDLRSEFISAGINQTLHRIYLEVKCNVAILTPVQTIEEQIVNQVLLAEGVIVGQIPESYYNLNGVDKNNIFDTVQ